VKSRQLLLRRAVPQFEIMTHLRPRAIDVQHGSGGIGAESHRACLMRCAANRHVLAQIERTIEQMRMYVEFNAKRTKFFSEHAVSFHVGFPQIEDDAASIVFVRSFEISAVE
jgi:hypothetical protein